MLCRLFQGLLNVRADLVERLATKLMGGSSHWCNCWGHGFGCGCAKDMETVKAQSRAFNGCGTKRMDWSWRNYLEAQRHEKRMPIPARSATSVTAVAVPDSASPNNHNVTFVGFELGS